MTVTEVVTTERVVAEKDALTADAVVLSQDFIISQDFAQKKKNSFGSGGPTVFQHIDKGRAGVLEWSNMCYSVKVKDGRKEILQDVSGCLVPGKLTCILGPSGSGKTTLLNTLSGRVRPGGRFDAQINGTIQLNGQVTETWKNQHFFGYVMQEDCLFATENPREILTFAAKMRLRGIKPSEIACLVDNMLVSLGLEECASTMVGNDVIKGISGGQKKRTSIAAELITNPAITFLDEPTSGLDTAAAYKVISVLKELAKADQSVMCTVHQPSSEIFELFDTAIFIARGQVAYMGPPSDIRSHFGAIGYQCPQDYNPADFVMFTLELAEDHDYATMAQACAKVKELSMESKNFAARELPPRTLGKGFMTELSMLCARQYRNITRDKATLRSRCGMSVFMPMIFCLVFSQVGDMDRSTWELQTHIGGITMMGMNAMMGAAQPAILTFPSERPVFLREHASKMYGVIPYFLSKTVAEMVLLLIQIHLSLLINYFGMGLHGVFHVHFIALFLVAIATSSIALLIGSLIGNVKTAMEVTPLAFVPQILFAGFFIQMEQVPVFFRWMQYLCSLKWGLNIVQANEFGSWGADLPNYEIFLEKNDIDESLMGVYAAMLVGLTVFFRSLSMWKLKAAANTLYG
jgi:ABC-type multidrug transport system ATPase subunit